MEKIKTRFNENRTVWLTWIIALAPLLFLAIIFNRIPEEIPVKYNEAGEVIGRASKYSYHMFVQSSLGLIVAVVLSVLLKVVLTLNFKPDRKNYEKVVSVMNMAVLAVTAMFSFSSLMILIKFI